MIDRRVKIDKQLSVIEFGEQSIIVELSIKRITVNCQFTVTIVNYWMNVNNRCQESIIDVTFLFEIVILIYKYNRLAYTK